MTAEHRDLGGPIPWPTEVIPDNIASVNKYLSQGNSLAVSVALTIVDEVKAFGKAELNELIATGPDSDLFNREYPDWSAFARPAYAILNAESILETGKLFQSPGKDFEALDREFRVSFKDFLLSEDKRKELREQRKAAGEIVWMARELTYADLYKDMRNNPLEFVDTVIRQEVERLYQQDKKDMETIHHLAEAAEQLKKERDEVVESSAEEEAKKEEVMEFIEGVGNLEINKKVDAMERGRQRVHQLYQEFNR